MKKLTHNFTLVEIMVVVGIIGMLTALVSPSLRQAREKSQQVRFMNDLRVASGAFQLFALENAGWPADRTPGVVPTGMSGYLGTFPWQQDTTIGGQWDWDYNQFGFTAGVSVYQPARTGAQMAEIDNKIDDGNLAQGNFRTRSSGYIFILEH